MSFLNRIGKPLALGVGAAALGGLLFPETMGSMTGGVFGTSPAVGGNSLGADIASTSIPKSLADSSSIWSNPTVISSGILAGTSLLAGLFGTTAEEDAQKLQASNLEEQKRQFDAKLALEKEQMAQALQIAQIQAGASRGAGNGAGVTAAAQKAIAKANLIQSAANMKAQALQIPLQARENQSNAAQTTGTQSGSFFNTLSQSLMQPALTRA